MSLNPLTLINQAIEEHGSAGIMGKHLAFVKDQLAALKEQQAADGLRATELQADNARLKSENEHLRQEIQKLQPNAERLDDDTKKILKFYFDAADSVAIHYAASRLGLHPSAADALAHDLYKKDFLALTGIGDCALYAIISKGSKYVMKHLL